MKRVTLLSVLSLLSCLSQVQACSQWGPIKKVGTLDAGLLPEESGMAFSKAFPDRLYHINDSGRGPFFYTTNEKGEKTSQIKIEGDFLRDSDFEAISTLRLNGKFYVVVADIGNNFHKDQKGRLLFFKEQAHYSLSMAPIAQIYIRFPDGLHDAEGMSIHPNGDLFVLSKEWKPSQFKTLPARMYRIPAAVITMALQKKGITQATLEPWGELDLAKTAPTIFDFLSHVPTDLSISPQGDRFLVLTYKDAFEFFFDLSKKPLPSLWKKNQFQRISLVNLEQQEAISYTPGGHGFLYSSERRMINPPLMQVNCAGS